MKFIRVDSCVLGSCDHVACGSVVVPTDELNSSAWRAKENPIASITLSEAGLA